MSHFHNHRHSISNIHQPRSNYHSMYNYLQQSVMLYHQPCPYDQSTYHLGPFCVFRLIILPGVQYDGRRNHNIRRNGRFQETPRRRRIAAFRGMNGSIEDETVIFDGVRGEVANFGTAMLNDLGLMDGENRTSEKEEEALNAAIRRSLSTRIYQKTSSNSDQDSGFCVVCQSEFLESEVLGKLECGHEYHADCIHRWLLEKNLCPLCKQRGIRA